ncbi:putative acyl--CoA ligase YhfT [mine drainage metagenome]|uniref:Putative acyl--CoA ligase YhfT n=1 Tax=mine drainage metagenome TaxID=410659 RepID=A0A1J5RBC0_9ZZZZ
MINLQSIRQHSARTPNKDALVDGDTGITWQEFQIDTEKKIQFLLTNFKHGLPKQVCYISHNRIELISWLSAFSTLNIPITGLDYSLPVAILKKLSLVIGAELILVSMGSLINDDEVFGSGWSRSVLFDLDSPTIVYVDAVGKPLSLDNPENLSKANPSYLYRAVGLTSGTSGLPKAVIRTESFDKRRFTYFTSRYGFNHEDVFLLSMPLYHAAGNGWARMFMNLGATIYFSRLDSPSGIAEIMSEKRITASVMTPSLLARILDALESKDYKNNNHLKWLLIGGKHFPVSQKLKALSKLGQVIYEYYGTTETGVNTIAEPDDLANYPDSVGRAFDGNTVAIVGPKGTRLGPNAIGTIAISSYMNMDCYSDGSSKAVMLDNNRFLLTSETGYLDAEGRLYLLNRSINQNNNPRHLYRLEDAIRCIPGVRDVALLENNDNSNTTIECAIEMKAQSVKPQDLQAQIQLLADKEQLQLIRYYEVSKIPYSPSGKVRVGDLRLLLGKSYGESEQIVSS